MRLDRAGCSLVSRTGAWRAQRRDGNDDDTGAGCTLDAGKGRRKTIGPAPGVLQSHSVSFSFMQFHAVSCSFTRFRAVPCSFKRSQRVRPAKRDETAITLQPSFRWLHQLRRARLVLQQKVPEPPLLPARVRLNLAQTAAERETQGSFGNPEQRFCKKSADFLQAFLQNFCSGSLETHSKCNRKRAKAGVAPLVAICCLCCLGGFMSK